MHPLPPPSNPLPQPLMVKIMGDGFGGEAFILLMHIQSSYSKSIRSWKVLPEQFIIFRYTSNTNLIRFYLARKLLIKINYRKEWVFLYSRQEGKDVFGRYMAPKGFILVKGSNNLTPWI